jgi:hypothetical protein
MLEVGATGISQPTNQPTNHYAGVFQAYVYDL